MDEPYRNYVSEAPEGALLSLPIQMMIAHVSMENAEKKIYAVQFHPEGNSRVIW